MKTNCDQSLLEISDHLDSGNKLNPTTQAHLQTCPDCTSFLEAWQPTGYLATNLKTPIALTPTNSLADQILEKLPKKQSPKNIIRFAPALAAAATLTIGIFIWKSPQTPTNITPTPTIIAKHTPTNTPEKLPEILGEIDQQKISRTLTDLGHSSTSLINNSSRNIHKLTSKLEYVTTNLSKLIPLPTPQNNLDTNIPTQNTTT